MSVQGRGRDYFPGAVENSKTAQIYGEIVLGIHLEKLAFQQISESVAEVETSAGRGVADRCGPFDLKHLTVQLFSLKTSTVS